MFEKEAEEYALKKWEGQIPWGVIQNAFKDGAEYGYNKGKEDVKYDLMIKLKDEGIVKPLKDSIFYNERLSSQEQQELCAWIECAMNFGENLEQLKKANEWHFPSKGELPRDYDKVLAYIESDMDEEEPFLNFAEYHNCIWKTQFSKVPQERIIAWRYLPEPPKEVEPC